MSANDDSGDIARDDASLNDPPLILQSDSGVESDSSDEHMSMQEGHLETVHEHVEMDYRLSDLPPTMPALEPDPEPDGQRAVG